VASKLVERQRRYKSILIPVGLVKVLSDIRFYDSVRPRSFALWGSAPARFTRPGEKRRHQRGCLFPHDQRSLQSD
jgi:hypothetical protein